MAARFVKMCEGMRPLSKREIPLLSICVPTYNRLPYLKELLHELVKQVYAHSIFGDVELCVSNNASTDGTEAYLQTLTDYGVRWWTNPENIGGDRNFLKCIEEAKGEYVWLVGDDELLPEWSVSNVLRALDRHHPDLLISIDSTDYECLYANYREYLRQKCDSDSRMAMAHTLISANIFRRAIFDGQFAVRMLYTQYAHMFGLVCNLDGKVLTRHDLIKVRPVRAEFAKYPNCLCLKQAVYLNYLAKRFRLLRFRWFALVMASNLPFEFASRIKNWYLRRFGGA